jgi:hypothetical protein
MARSEQDAKAAALRKEQDAAKRAFDVKRAELRAAFEQVAPTG